MNNSDDRKSDLDGKNNHNDLYLDGEERFGVVLSRLYSAFSGLATWKMYRNILDYVVKLNASRILDVGCGPGDLLVKVALSGKDSILLGVDPSPSMVRIAGKKIRKHNLTDRVRVETGSSREMQSEGKYDLIMTSFSFHHWINREESIGFLLNRLDKRGTLVIFDMNASGSYGRIPIVKSHALSEEYAGSLQYEGYRRNIEYSKDRKLIILSFRKETDSDSKTETND